MIAPVLLTGDFVTDTLTMLKEKGSKKIYFMYIIAVPVGIKKINMMSSGHGFVHRVAGRLSKRLRIHRFWIGCCGRSHFLDN